MALVSLAKVSLSVSTSVTFYVLFAYPPHNSYFNIVMCFLSN
jgi:hypothetical protein